MKKFVIAMAIVLLIGGIMSGAGCAVYFKGDQQMAFKKLEYTEQVFVAEAAFDSLRLDFYEPHSLKFERGEGYGVRYSVNQYSDTAVSVEDGKLCFKERRWSWKNWIQRLFCRFNTTEVVVTVPDDVVLAIDANIRGASDISLPSWQYGDIDLDVSGAAVVGGENIVASDIKVSVSGGATVKLNGSMKKVCIDCSGAADIGLSGKADELRVYASGSSDVACTQLESPLVNIEVSGSADIALAGKGEVLNVHSSGSSEIWARDFAVARAVLQSSGSVTAQVKVSEHLSISVSGSADVEYWGDPQVEKSISGSASVRKAE